MTYVIGIFFIMNFKSPVNVYFTWIGHITYVRKALSNLNIVFFSDWRRTYNEDYQVFEFAELTFIFVR